MLGTDQGLHFKNGKRHLSNGTAEVAYTLWSDASATTEWGDRGMNTIEPNYVETYPAPAVAGTGIGNSQDIPLWGSVKSSSLPPGSYQDEVVMTIVW